MAVAAFQLKVRSVSIGGSEGVQLLTQVLRSQEVNQEERLVACNLRSFLGCFIPRILGSKVFVDATGAACEAGAPRSSSLRCVGSPPADNAVRTESGRTSLPADPAYGATLSLRLRELQVPHP
jgi:hypothetical protein